MFDADLVHAVLDVVPDAVVDGGWGVDALAGRQTRPHDDLDLVVEAGAAGSAVAALGALGFVEVTDERPARVLLANADGRPIDLHLVERTSAGTTQRLPGGMQFTYFLDDCTGVIGGRSVRCLSPEMQLLTHAGYEPDDDDRADVAARRRGLRARAATAVRATGAERRSRVACGRRPSTTSRRCASSACDRGAPAYAGLMPQQVIDALDIGTMWSTWRAAIRPPGHAIDPIVRRGSTGRGPRVRLGPSDGRNQHDDRRGRGDVQRSDRVGDQGRLDGVQCRGRRSCGTRGSTISTCGC